LGFNCFSHSLSTKIVPDLILAIFVGAIITIALVIGISFGLAGKEVAAKFLKEIEEKLK
jgi:hypothetical protein